MDELAKAKYISFGTYRRDGTLVSTPTWIVPFGDGYAFTTEAGSGKTKRLSRDPRVVVTSCNFRGATLPGASTFEGRGELLEGNAIVEVKRAIRRKYQLMGTLIALPSLLLQKVLRRPKAVEAAIFFVLDSAA